LYVAGPPEITLSTDSVVLVKGRVGVLDCPYLANPQPQDGGVQWSKDGTLLDANEVNYNVFLNGSLLIRNLTCNDSGNYTCSVTNDEGSDKAVLKLQVISESKLKKQLKAFVTLIVYPYPPRGFRIHS